MPAIIAFFSALFGRIITEGVVKYLAYKAMLLFLFVFVLPAVLLKLFFWIKTYMLDLVVQIIDSELLSGFDLGTGLLELTGLAAYLGNHLNLVEGVAVLISCAVSGWIISLIRG